MMPKQSSTTSALDETVANPRSVSSGIHVPPCGLPNSSTVFPSRSPSASTCSRADLAWSVSDRGLFTRAFDADIFDDYLGASGFSASFVQDSQSRSSKGVIRGMHGRSGRGEAKLVRFANGAVHDVLIDIRRKSPTFGRQEAFL